MAFGSRNWSKVTQCSGFTRSRFRRKSSSGRQQWLWSKSGGLTKKPLKWVVIPHSTFIIIRSAPLLVVDDILQIKSRHRDQLEGVSDREVAEAQICPHVRQIFWQLAIWSQTQDIPLGAVVKIILRKTNLSKSKRKWIPQSWHHYDQLSNLLGWAPNNMLHLPLPVPIWYNPLPELNYQRTRV